MRTLLCMGCFLFVMFQSGCATTVRQDRWSHFAFSTAAASACTAAGAEPGTAVAAAAGLGLLKEIYDGLYGSGFSCGDLIWDAAGAIAGGYTAYAILEEDP